MKLRLLLLSILGSSLSSHLLADPPSYINTSDAIVVFTGPLVRVAPAIEPEIVANNTPALKPENLTPLVDLKTGAASLADGKANIIPDKSQTMNYSGWPATFFQNNIQVAMPFSVHQEKRLALMQAIKKKPVQEKIMTKIDSLSKL